MLEKWREDRTDKNYHRNLCMIFSWGDRHGEKQGKKSHRSIVISIQLWLGEKKKKRSSSSMGKYVTSCFVAVPEWLFWLDITGGLFSVSEWNTQESRRGGWSMCSFFFLFMGSFTLSQIKTLWWRDRVKILRHWFCTKKASLIWWDLLKAL